MVGQANAFNTRLEGLRQGLENQGASTDILSLRSLRFSRPHLLFPLNARTIATKAKGFDVIHAASAGSTVAAALAVASHSRLVVFDIHGDELQEAELDWRARPTLRRTYQLLQAMILTPLAHRLADAFLVVSEPFRSRYEEKRIPADRIALVRNGVDTALFKPLGSRNDGQLHFCYAGGFQSWQAIDVLVEAIAQVDDDRVHFNLIGFSERDGALKAEIAYRLGSRVTLENWMPTSQLVNRLGKVDVLVIPRTKHPAMRGGSPSKFAEYLAMGKPLIVTNVDETASFVHEYQCGIVCEPEVKGMVDAFEHAAKWNEHDRQILGANSRNLAESVFDWNIVARNYIDVIEDYIGTTLGIHDTHSASDS